VAQTDNTRAVVGDLLQRIGVGDPATIAQAYAEQVTWTLGWPEDELGGPVPWIRARSTRADVEDHYRTVAELHVPGETTVDVTAVLVDGADAAVVGELGQTLKANQVHYVTKFIIYLSVADGLVTRHHIIEDNLAVKRAYDAAA